MTATFDSLVRDVRSAMRGYNLLREQVAFLSGSITSSALTLTVDDGSLIRPGVVEIDSECLWVQTISGNAVTISPDGRGWDGTTAASHADKTRVTVNPPLPAWRIQQEVNAAIVGTSPTLYGVGTTTFVYDGVKSTYDLPADCLGVLRVQTTDPGPSNEQPELHGYKLDLTAKTITLREAGLPGQTVTVVYQKTPAELLPGQVLTDSGLADTARTLVVYGTLARLLSTVDASRSLADTAVAAELGQVHAVGSATQLAAQMTARYQMELDAEQKRLTKAHPPRVRWMGR